MERLEEFFELEFKNLTYPTRIADHAHKANEKSFDELHEPYKRQLLQLRVEIADKVRDNTLSNLPFNFIPICERVDKLLTDVHAKNIQDIINDEKNRIHRENKRK